MDPVGLNPWVARDASSRDGAEEFLLPSRVAALGTLRRGVAARCGPILITGEPGVGKTWLWRRLRAEQPPPWRWVSIDVSPAIDPAGFYRLIGHGLGLPGLGEPAGSRSRLADYLEGSFEDGARWVVVIDEAQNASDDVAEEVRVLSNRIGHRNGFTGLILAAQTSLVRRIAAQPLAALGARLESRLTLRPLDVEEARALVDRVGPPRAWAAEAFEALHRDTGGNPRRLLHAVRGLALSRDARRAPGRNSDQSEVRPVPQTTDQGPPAETRSSPQPAWETPILGPDRPPIRAEDGVIEVGWEPAEEPAPGLEPTPVPEGSLRVSESSVGTAGERNGHDETIDDHYAALRAWSEWARNQGRGPSAGPGTATADAESEHETSGLEENAFSPESSATNVWAEGQQGFAPYSQLFTRLRQRRDTR